MERNGLPNGQHAAGEQHGNGPPNGDAEKVKQLEAEVRFLASENAAAADKLVDCEEEIRRLRVQLQQQQQPSTNGRATPELAQQPAVTEASALPRRFPSFMHSRKTASASSQSTISQVAELQAALGKEQALRQTAEEKVKQVNEELEDLSQNLFEEANKMVSSERIANAKLQDRLKELEVRDVDRKRRLEKLEAAIGRIERVQKLLAS